MKIYDLPLKLVSQLLFTVFCVILFCHKPYPDSGIDNVAEDGCLFYDWQALIDLRHIGGNHHEDFLHVTVELLFRQFMVYLLQGIEPVLFDILLYVIVCVQNLDEFAKLISESPQLL